MLLRSYRLLPILTNLIAVIVHLSIWHLIDQIVCGFELLGLKNHPIGCQQFLGHGFVKPPFNWDLNRFNWVFTSLVGVNLFWFKFATFFLVVLTWLCLTYLNKFGNLLGIILAHIKRFRFFRFLNIRYWGPYIRSGLLFVFIDVLLKHLLDNRRHVWWLFLLKRPSYLGILRIYGRLITFQRQVGASFFFSIMDWLIAKRRRKFHVSLLPLFKVADHLYILEAHAERLWYHSSTITFISSAPIIWSPII